MHSKCITSLCTCMYCIYVFVLVSMHIVCTMHRSLCMHATVTCITCMHFQCFKEKHCTLIVFHNRIFLKNWGGGAKCITGPPPQSVLGGGAWPPCPPPRGGPHAVLQNRNKETVRLAKYVRTRDGNGRAAMTSA